jgi:hypothetical protein
MAQPVAAFHSVHDVVTMALFSSFQFSLIKRTTTFFENSLDSAHSLRNQYPFLMTV